jgi:hypothetical protein
MMSRYGELNPRPLPYQGSALPLSYNGGSSVGSLSTVRQVISWQLAVAALQPQTANRRLQTEKERKTGLEPATYSLEGYRSTK